MTKKYCLMKDLYFLWLLLLRSQSKQNGVAFWHSFLKCQWNNQVEVVSKRSRHRFILSHIWIQMSKRNQRLWKGKRAYDWDNSRNNKQCRAESNFSSTDIAKKSKRMQKQISEWVVRSEVNGRLNQVSYKKKNLQGYVPRMQYKVCLGAKRRKVNF